MKQLFRKPRPTFRIKNCRIIRIQGNAELLDNRKKVVTNTTAIAAYN